MMRSLCCLLILVSVCVSDYCPSSVTTTIQECVQPVGEYAKKLNKNQDESKPGDFSAISLPNMGKTVFNELCKLVQQFNECVRTSRDICPKHVTLGLIDSSYGYLCNEGYDTFVNSAECLMELDRKPTVKACHDRTLKDIEEANGEKDLDITEKVSRMCSALNYFSGCVRTPIKGECGSQAWRVIHRVLKDTTRTLMPGCVFTSSSPLLTTAPSRMPFYFNAETSVHATTDSSFAYTFATIRTIQKQVTSPTEGFGEPHPASTDYLVNTSPDTETNTSRLTTVPILSLFLVFRLFV